VDLGVIEIIGSRVVEGAGEDAADGRGCLEGVGDEGEHCGCFFFSLDRLIDCGDYLFEIRKSFRGVGRGMRGFI
jgi:hypothetical protein